MTSRSIALEPEQINKWIAMCKETLTKSYCVYSNFPVACVIETDCGKLFTGCNVENASYGLCICAERTAIVKAVSEGYRKFTNCTVLTNSLLNIAPCGSCLQFMAEFEFERVILAKKDLKYTVHDFKTMLPFAFTSKDLDSGIEDPSKVSPLSQSAI